MLFESVVTNVVYYGAAFTLYITEIRTSTLTEIAFLFGIGNAPDTAASFGSGVYLMKKIKFDFISRYQDRMTCDGIPYVFTRVLLQKIPDSGIIKIKDA